LTGKNPSRIREILERGSVISGGARFRWQGIQASEAELAALLARFPDADPARPFDGSKCRLAMLRSQRGVVELSRETASERRLLKRQNFWDVLLPAIEPLSPRYERYSYADRADVYTVRLTPAVATLLRDQAALLKYSILVQRLQATPIESVELLKEKFPFTDVPYAVALKDGRVVERFLFFEDPALSEKIRELGFAE
jgi:hypothetical protein